MHEPHTKILLCVHDMLSFVILLLILLEYPKKVELSGVSGAAEAVVSDNTQATRGIHVDSFRSCIILMKVRSIEEPGIRT